MIRGVCTACAAIAVACGSNPELEGAARVDAVFTVPSTSVNCIRVVASGMKRSVQKDFAVTAGQSTITLEMHAIPTGTVMFSGNA